MSRNCPDVRTAAVMVVSLIAFALSPSASRADEPAAAGPAATAPEDQEAQTDDEAAEGRVERVTVTALKRATKVQNTGASITALSGAEIESRGAQKAQDLQYQVPGLIYGETQGTSQISIRGVGLSVETGFAEQGVASYIDGVFLPRPGMTNLNFGDVAQVEVLRGPQGTLYGRNATGGIINYITRKPTEEFEAGFTAGYADFDTYRGEAYVSGPISENVLGRLFVTGRDTDGFIENPLGFHVGDEATAGGRASLRVLANETLTLDLQAMYLKQSGGYIYNQATHGFGPLNLAPPASLEPHVVTSEIDPDADHEVYGAVATASFEFAGGVQGKSITSYLRETRDEFYDSDGVPLALTWVDRRDTSKSMSQEFDFNGSSFGGKLDWVAGLYYFHEDATLDIGVPFFGGLATIAQGLAEDNTTYGVFTDLTLNVSDDFRLVGGLRYGRDEKDIGYRYDNPLGPVACTGSVDLAFDSLNPKVGVEFNPGDDALLYAQYARGTKPGGANLSSPTCDETFDEEKIDAYEVGAKHAFANGRLIVNGAAFYYDYTDYQVFQINFPTSAVVNAPKSTVKGVELELLANLTKDLKINAGAMYLSAEYDEFTDVDSFGIVCAIPGECPGIPYLPSPLPQDLSGNRLSRSPEWTFNFGVENTWILGGDVFGSLKIRGEAYYIDDVFFRQFNEVWDTQEAYWLGNLFVTLASADEKWALRGFVKNIGDEDYIVSQFSNAAPLGNSSTFGNYGPPRTIGVELSARFD